MTDVAWPVGVVGLGVGEQHARAFANISDTPVKMLCDWATDKAKQLADELSVPAVTDAFDQLCADKQIRIISIASFDDAHAAQVLSAIEAGKHVFVEKPLCRTQTELQQIIKAWQKTPVALMTNCVLRAAPLYRWLKRVINEGMLGDVYAIDGEYLYGRVHKITTGWRNQVPDYSVMTGGGVHMVDLMLMLLNERPTRVQALGNKIVTRDTDFAYDDFQTALYSFESGIIGRITANFGCVHRHHHVLKVYGTKATFIYDDMGPRLHTSCDENACAKPIAQAPLPMHKGALIPDFLAVIASGDYHHSMAHESHLTAVLAATQQAHEMKQPLDIEYCDL